MYGVINRNYSSEVLKAGLIYRPGVKQRRTYRFSSAYKLWLFNFLCQANHSSNRAERHLSHPDASSLSGRHGEIGAVLRDGLPLCLPSQPNDV